MHRDLEDQSEGGHFVMKVRPSIRVRVKNLLGS